MTPKSVRVSVFQQVLHEFRTAIRRSQSEGISRQEIESQILILIKDSSKELSKMAVGLLIVAISVENLRQGTLLPIKTSLVEISVPAIYAAFLGALLWFGLIISSITQIQYVSAKLAGQYVFHKWRRFSEVEWALSGSNFIDVTSPLRNGHLFVLWLPFRATLHITYFIMILVLSIPIIGSVWSLLSVAMAEIVSTSSAYLGKPIAFATVALIVLPVLYFIAYFTPFPIRKDLKTIRWNFLVNLVWGSNRLHPQSSKWLGKKRA
jgi:hypothetical protein